MNSQHFSTKKPTVFSLSTTPLDGSNLLEAGAGTGKTYSLSFLYLRLILEKGLKVEEILVTTFTLAATAELKGRIFDTIQSAEQAFHNLCAGIDGDDDFITELLQTIRSQIDDDALLKQRFRLALAQFDYAQIHTINGFALQLLREHADVLASYSPEQVLNDDSDIVKQAYLEMARDNFNQFGDGAKAIGKAVTTFQSTDALFALLANMLSYRAYIKHYLPTLTEQVANVQATIDQLANCDIQAALSLLADAIEGKQLNGRSYSLKKLQQFAAQLDTPAAFSDKKCLAFFAHSELLKKRNKGATETFDQPFFHCCDALLAQADALKTVEHKETYEALLTLCDALAERVATIKAEQMALTHDDVVSTVADKASLINTPLKAALIDEAQDTSRQQMSLFSTLFLDKKDTVVFFVGDPKQAIYGFRGANVYSYLAIEKAVDRHYIMDTNYRSSRALNRSINTFFSGHLPFASDQIRYHAIQLTENNEHPYFGDKALTFVSAESAGAEGLAVACAETLVTMLDHYRLDPTDIAVLVRTGAQAKRIKAALADCGLSASFTGKMRVYETDEAMLMLALLRAVHTGNVRLVKSLLLTPLFNYALTAIHRDLVNEIAATLHGFADSYRQNGFGVMFYRLMNHFSIAERLLNGADGNRRLTNFIQLFELLQQVLQEQALSLAGLCDHLNNAIQDARQEAELRLEGEDAITIMTMHNAKGLEFPVVCLPFFEYHSERSSDGLLVSHQQQAAAPAFLQPQLLIDRVKAENAQENRRLAYVALTRAKYHNIIIRQPADSNRYKKSAMLTELLETLDNPTQLTQGEFVAPPPDAASATAIIDAPKPRPYRAKQLRQTLHSKWQLASFSRLQQQASAHHLPVQKAVTAANDAAPITGALANYPAGARPGTALHEMYEHFLKWRHNDSDFHTAIERSLERHLLNRERQQCPDTAALAEAVEETTSVTLTPQPFCLQDIALEQQSIEMKFFMHLRPKARRQLLEKFGLNSAHTAIIPTDGYVHGYIDYCFAQANQFYVLDYKSNRLGDTYSDYDRTAMHQEMLRHRYDLQAFIYTLALCKHLGIDSEKAYRETIGGYYYLFVRGMKKDQSTGIYHDRIDWAELADFLSN